MGAKCTRLLESEDNFEIITLRFKPETFNV